GLSVAHYDLRFVKPLDEELLAEVGRRFGRVVTVEDGCVRGGAGEAVAAWLNARGCGCTVRSLGIGDEWVDHGTPAQLQARCGYDEEGILRALREA
ncbi:transketolase C-terminal domain-containing protein, partial [uncultured Alistipes sp.]